MMVIARLLAVVLLALAGACGGKSCPPAGPAPIAEAPGSSEPWDLGDPRASAGGGEDEEEDEDEGDDDDDGGDDDDGSGWEEETAAEPG